MRSCLFAGFRRRLCRNQVSLAGPYKIMLTRGFVADAAFHDVRADVPNEAKGKGYEAGGKSASVSWETEGESEVMHIEEIEWPNSQIEADGAVLYFSAGDNPLVTYWHFADAMDEKECPGGVVKSRNDRFRLMLPDGAMRI